MSKTKNLNVPNTTSQSRRKHRTTLVEALEKMLRANSPLCGMASSIMNVQKWMIPICGVTLEVANMATANVLMMVSIIVL